MRFFVYAFPQGGECSIREEKGVYHLFHKKGEIRTYVDLISNSSGMSEVDTKTLKDAIENALATRLTLSFKLVPDKAEADIVIKCDVIEYTWMDEDPVDAVYGLAAAAIDIMSKDHYARMRAVFSVVAAQKNDLIWKKELQATITDRNMTREESFAMLDERMVKVFMRDCFSKNH